jgi:release factor glutamine methyltransferase
MPATVQTLLTQARQQLAATSESPRLDAEVLLCHVLNASRAYLYANPDQAMNARQIAAYTDLITRRCHDQPVAHLTGVREFWSLTLRVTPDVLVPRPETELLVEQALSRIPVGEACDVLDLGCGSGAIVIAIATERPAARLIAVDSSAAALQVARDNAAAHNCGRIRFREGSWFAPVGEQRFNVIVSNPPYVATGQPQLTDPELAHEPPQALYSGVDGLDDIRRIIKDAPTHLQPGGRLLLEHGFDQAGKIAELLERAGFTAIHTHADIAGHPRVTEGRLGAQE